MAGGFGAIHEEEDNWLQGYLATTKYGSDQKLTSTPVRAKKEDRKPEKKEKKDKKKMYRFLVPGGLQDKERRRSMSAVNDVPEGSRSQRSDIVRVEQLPDRVNAIRQGPAPAGHFVREHRKSKEHPEATMEGPRKLAKGASRRKSLDYDELDAVKLRVSQAAKVWEEEKIEAEDSEEINEDCMPASVLPSVVPSLVEPSKASRGGWFRWQNKPVPASAS